MHSPLSQISPLSQSLIDVQLSPSAAAAIEMNRNRDRDNTRSAPTFFMY